MRIDHPYHRPAGISFEAVVVVVVILAASVDFKYSGRSAQSNVGFDLL